MARAVHEALWVAEGQDGMRMSLATHSTNLIRLRGQAQARLLITLSPREEHRDRVIASVHGIVSDYARAVQGTVHPVVEDEDTLRGVATGKLTEL